MLSVRILKESLVQAAKIMTFGAATIQPQASIRDAAHIMLSHRISGLPVVDDSGTLVGMVTESDLLEAAVAGLVPKVGEPRAQLHVSDVMSREVQTVSPDTPVHQIIATMRDHAIKRLPVVADGKIVGIVSRADLLRSLASEASLTLNATEDDYALRDRVLAALESEPKSGWTSLNVLVEDGVVEVRGAMTDETLRHRLIDAARRIASEHRVEDHLVVVGPASGRL